VNLESYLPVLLFILVGLAVGAGPLLIGKLLGPNRPDPEKLSPYECGFVGFWSMMVFLGILTVGFVYEWKKGALDWE